MAWSCHYATWCFLAFLGDISTLKSGWNMKKKFCCPALELFHCLPLWKTVLFVSSRAFSLSTPLENSEATWKKPTKCNKSQFCSRVQKNLRSTKKVLYQFLVSVISRGPLKFLKDTKLIRNDQRGYQCAKKTNNVWQPMKR